MTRTERNRALREAKKATFVSLTLSHAELDALLADSDALEAAEREREEARTMESEAINRHDRLTNRADAAEARVKVLEAALKKIDHECGATFSPSLANKVIGQLQQIARAALNPEQPK